MQWTYLSCRKDIYRYLAAVGSPSNVFSIQLNAYTDFVKTCGLVDGNTVKQATSDTEFISINKRNKVSPMNPGVAIIRFQFLEILMRLALRRYDETKQAPNKGESIKMMIKNNLV